jgi:hypothetical protein
MYMTVLKMWVNTGLRDPPCGQSESVHNEAKLYTLLSTRHPQRKTCATCDYVVCPQKSQAL